MEILNVIIDALNISFSGLTSFIFDNIFSLDSIVFLSPIALIQLLNLSGKSIFKKLAVFLSFFKFFN